MNVLYSSIIPPLSSRTLLALSDAFEATFDSSDWSRLGLELDLPALHDSDSCLQRSLRFQDDDYGTCIVQFIRHLENEKPSALRSLAQRPETKAWIEAHRPDAADELELKGLHVPAQAPPQSASEVVRRTLQDADQLLKSSCAVSAVDHTQTALHGNLRDVCKRPNLAAPDDANAAYLFKVVRCKQPRLHAMSQHGAHVGNILASLAGAVTALNTLRNNASMAHSNPELLDEPEAMLMVNLVRTLFNYLETWL